MTVIVAGDHLIPVGEVVDLDISRLADLHTVTVHTHEGEYPVEGFHAIEAVMLLCPSALEGRRFRWRRGAWALHNLIGHPVMQILAWLGKPELGVRFHDYTTPRPQGFR